MMSVAQALLGSRTSNWRFANLARQPLVCRQIFLVAADTQPENAIPQGALTQPPDGDYSFRQPRAGHHGSCDSHIQHRFPAKNA